MLETTLLQPHISYQCPIPLAYFDAVPVSVSYSVEFLCQVTADDVLVTPGYVEWDSSASVGGSLALLHHVMVAMRSSLAVEEAHENCCMLLMMM